MYNTPICPPEIGFTTYTELKEKCPNAQGWAVDENGNFTPLYY